MRGKLKYPYQSAGSIPDSNSPLEVNLLLASPDQNYLLFFLAFIGGRPTNESHEAYCAVYFQLISTYKKSFSRIQHITHTLTSENNHTTSIINLKYLPKLSHIPAIAPLSSIVIILKSSQKVFLFHKTPL